MWTKFYRMITVYNFITAWCSDTHDSLDHHCDDCYSFIYYSHLLQKCRPHKSVGHEPDTCEWRLQEPIQSFVRCLANLKRKKIPRIACGAGNWKQIPITLFRLIPIRLLIICIYHTISRIIWVMNLIALASAFSCAWYCSYPFRPFWPTFLCWHIQSNHRSIYKYIIGTLVVVFLFSFLFSC